MLSSYIRRRLITDEDCCVEDFDLSQLDMQGVATLSCDALRSSRPVSAAVAAFEDCALQDAAARLGRSNDPAVFAQFI